MRPQASEIRAGRLLVATPTLADPNFSHTVVLLLEHSEEGTLGVVLNRPSDIEVRDALPGWERLAGAHVHLGGPVQTTALLALGRGEASAGVAQQITPRVAALDLDADPAGLVGTFDAVRVFVGYAGWDAGQLADEIEVGGWFVVDAQPDDPFTDAPESLWRRVLQRQGGVYRTVPLDPSLN